MVENSVLEKLEYFKILSLLAKHTSNPYVKKEILKIKPMFNAKQAEKELEKIESLKNIILKESHPHPVNFENLDFLFNITSSVFKVENFLELKKFIYSFNSYRKYFLKFQNELSFLADKFKNVPNFNQLLTKIESSIDNRGDIKDTASPAIKKIRKKINALSSHINKKLNELLRKNKSFFQDEYITVRNNRFVLPVKAEHRKDVKGFLHDRSNTSATFYIEPVEVIELNNNLRDLFLSEQIEIAKILKNLTESVISCIDSLKQAFNLFVEAETYFAKATFALKYNYNPVKVKEKGTIKLLKCIHPLLGKGIKIDFCPPPDKKAVIISGPNAGGKTVAMKTVGILTLMVASGIQIPASKDSELIIFQNIFCDIGDEQSIEQNLSSFTSHLKNLSHILKSVITSPDTTNSLVLLDEIAVGTDPKFGAALAMSILEELLKKNVFIILTTHYSELKIFGFENELCINASVAIEKETLQPLYHINMGYASESFAYSIAKKMKFPAHIIENALKKTKDSSIENALRKIRLLYETLKEKEVLLNQKIAELNQKELLLKKQEEELKLREKRKLKDLFTEIEEEIKSMRRHILKFIQNKEKVRLSDFDKLAATTKSKLKSLKLKLEPEPSYSLENNNTYKFKSDDIALLDEDKKVCILNINSRKNTAKVELNGLVLNVNINRLKPLKSPMHPEENIKIAYPAITETISDKIDLRGETVENAISNLEQFIDKAVRARLKRITVIHGKGSGSLRKAINNYLKTHPLVKSHRLADFFEGGSGATIVEL